MRQLLVGAAVAASLASFAPAAQAAPTCQPGTVQVDCDYCEDPAGNPAPPQFCQNPDPNNPFHWVNCTLWVLDRCVVG